MFSGAVVCSYTSFLNHSKSAPRPPAVPRICHELAVTLSAAVGNHEPLSGRGVGRDVGVPLRGFIDLRQACEVGCNLADLLVRNTLVGRKGWHDSPRRADSAHELRGSQRMACQIRGKSTLSLRAVTESAIIVEAFPKSFPRLKVRGTAGRALGQRKQE